MELGEGSIETPEGLKNRGTEGTGVPGPFTGETEGVRRGDRVHEQGRGIEFSGVKGQRTGVSQSMDRNRRPVGTTLSID